MWKTRKKPLWATCEWPYVTVLWKGRLGDYERAMICNKLLCLLRAIRIYHIIQYSWHGITRIGGVMASVLASSAVDRGFEPRSSQSKDYKIGICCFFAKHAALKRKSKDWLARNQDNVSECGDMSISALLFQWASTIKIQLSVLT